MKQMIELRLWDRELELMGQNKYVLVDVDEIVRVECVSGDVDWMSYKDAKVYLRDGTCLKLWKNDMRTHTLINLMRGACA